MRSISSMFLGVVLSLSASAALAAGAPGSSWGGHKAVVSAPVVLSGGVNGAAYGHGHKAVVSAPVVLSGVNGAAYGGHRH